MSFRVEQIDLCERLNEFAKVMNDSDLMEKVKIHQHEIRLLPFCLHDTQCILKEIDRNHRHKFVHSPDKDNPILHKRILRAILELKKR